MKVAITSLPLEKIETECLVIPLFEEEAKNLPETVKNLLEKNNYEFSINDFSGKLYETFLIPAKTKILLLGVGKKENFDSRLQINCSGAAARRLVKSKVKKVAFDARIYKNPSLIIEGFGIGEFDTGIYKTGKDKPVKIEELVVVGQISAKDLKNSLTYVETVNWVRHLVTEPANKLTPKHFVDEARKIAKNYKLQIEVIDEKEALKRGMGAFAGIAQGSHEPSFMLALKYVYNKTVPTLGVVGKGITFDSGGISIKPSDKMHEMKMDMAGAASVVGFMKMVGELKPKLNVVCVTPLTENLPGGGALKPGDVVKALNGKTIEVINTDAEGRVVLSDALVYAQKLGATKIVDLATLAGAIIVALGSEATAVLGNNQAFIDSVIKSGNEVGERMWQLPIYPEHKDMLRSDIADLANIPPFRGAGGIAGAVFLQEFIENKNSWAHLDICGTAWLDSEKPYISKGATGVGIRTLLNLIETLV